MISSAITVLFSESLHKPLFESISLWWFQHSNFKLMYQKLIHFELIIIQSEICGHIFILLKVKSGFASLFIFYPVCVLDILVKI